jgi:hypothetical protein
MVAVDARYFEFGRIAAGRYRRARCRAGRKAKTTDTEQHFESAYGANSQI